MLDRPPDAKRQRKAARQARWRRRQREGVIPLPTVEIDAAGIQWLISTVRVLDEADADDPAEIAAAITRMIANAARDG